MTTARALKRKTLPQTMRPPVDPTREELTPAQQVKLDAFQAELEERFRKRGRRFHPPPGP